MKPTELRIGNYVTSLTSILNGKTLVVTEVNETHFQAWGIDPDYRQYGSSDGFLAPIPLTEEWLLKFGFKKGDYETLVCEFKGFRITFDINGDIIDCYLDSTGLDILYVHQLQNLYFALTGKELTIK